MTLLKQSVKLLASGICIRGRLFLLYCFH